MRFEKKREKERARERVSFTSARMYIGVKFLARKEIIKCVLVLLGLNIEQEAQFCNNTDDAYKVKRLFVEFIIVFFYFFFCLSTESFHVRYLIFRCMTSSLTLNGEDNKPK